MSRATVQAGMNARLSLIALLLFALSACSDDATSPPPIADSISTEVTSSGPPRSEIDLAELATGVWLIDSVLDRDGEVVTPSPGEGGYSTRVIIANDGGALMAYDYCGSVPTQVILTKNDGFYLADLALEESTSMESCGQLVSAGNARFKPVDDTTILVSTRGLDVTLRLTDEPCPTFLADGC